MDKLEILLASIIQRILVYSDDCPESRIVFVYLSQIGRDSLFTCGCAVQERRVVGGDGQFMDVCIMGAVHDQL